MYLAEKAIIDPFGQGQKGFLLLIKMLKNKTTSLFAETQNFAPLHS